jgi:putative MFS transporter
METDRRPVESIPERQDKLPVTRLHLVVLVVCGLGLALDLMEIGFGGVLATIFGAPSQQLANRSLPYLLSAIYAGAIIGSPVAGVLADRWGRQKTLMALLWILIGSTVFSALSPSVGWLIAARFLTGFAVGAYQPVMLTYMTDLLPPLQRGMLFFSMTALALLGIPASTLLVRFLTPIQPFGIEAWRCGLWFAAVLTIVPAVLFIWLPESPRWLFSRGRTHEAEAAIRQFESSPSLKIAFRTYEPSAAAQQALPPSSARRPGYIAMTLFFLMPWSTVAFPILTGALLLGKGFKLSDALLYVALSTFGPVFGTLLAAYGIDRVPRRLSMAVCALTMLAAGYTFAISMTPGWLVAVSVLFSLAGALYVPVLCLYSAELIATHIRARVISIAWACNRVGAAIAPLLLVPLLRSGGTSAMYLVIGVTLVLSIVLVVTSVPGRQRLHVF